MLIRKLCHQQVYASIAYRPGVLRLSSYEFCLVTTLGALLWYYSRTLLLGEA